MTLTNEQAKEYIKSHPEIYFRKAKKTGYICPLCGNGEGSDGDGILINKRDSSESKYKCFKCGFYGDIFDFIRDAEGISGYKDAFQKAYEIYGIKIDSGYNKNNNSFSRQENTINRQETDKVPYTDYFLQVQKNIKDTDYLLRRGISYHTCEIYGIGFDPMWTSPKALKAQKTALKSLTSPRIIIPTSEYSYLARDTRENLTDEQKKYSKMKEGEVSIFNISSLYRYSTDSNTPVFITEGEIDALSVIEVGGEAISLGSVSNAKKLIHELQRRIRDKTDISDILPTLIISLDNDESGRRASEKLSEELTGMDIPFYVENIAGEYKDANEALQNDRDSFTECVMSAVNMAMEAREADRRAELDEYNRSNTFNHIQGFINGIEDSINTPAIPTGFQILDEKILDGGLYEGLYFIGAVSSLGKTTFVLQIADYIAQQGQHVLIFSLEMARYELMAKSISRITYTESSGDHRLPKTVRQITEKKLYSDYTKKEEDHIIKSAEKYSTFAQNIYINEGIGDIGVDEVRETVKRHVSITGKKPVVIIDYIQILSPSDTRSTDKQNTDKSVIELKRISRDYKIPVIGISSLNRENYNTQISMKAFKESGAIEYSSDVLIGLQVKAEGGVMSEEIIEEEKKKDIRRIELKILKNRNGRTGVGAEYEYNTKYNYFYEIGEAKQYSSISRKASNER